MNRNILTFFLISLKEVLFSIIQPSKHSSRWRRLEDSSSSSEDVLIKTNIFALVICHQKTSWSGPVYSSWPYVFKTSSRRICKRSSRRICKTSSRRLGRQKVVTLKTCWKRLQDMSWRRLEDVLKTNKCLLRNDIRWKHTELMFFDKLCPTNQCSSPINRRTFFQSKTLLVPVPPSASLLETCKLIGKTVQIVKTA